MTEGIKTKGANAACRIAGERATTKDPPKIPISLTPPKLRMTSLHLDQISPGKLGTKCLMPTDNGSCSTKTRTPKNMVGSTVETLMIQSGEIKIKPAQKMGHPVMKILGQLSQIQTLRVKTRTSPNPYLGLEPIGCFEGWKSPRIHWNLCLRHHWKDMTKGLLGMKKRTTFGIPNTKGVSMSCHLKMPLGSTW